MYGRALAAAADIFVVLLASGIVEEFVVLYFRGYYIFLVTSTFLSMQQIRKRNLKDEYKCFEPLSVEAGLTANSDGVKVSECSCRAFAAVKRRDQLNI